MHQIEPDPMRNRLMMGPDGRVHVVTSLAEMNSPPREIEGRPAAEQQLGTSDHTGLPADCDSSLPGIRRAPQTGVCFSYSDGMPLTDREVARRALQGIRRMPQGGVCFSYDGGQGTSCFSYSAETLRPDGGTGTGCFAY